MSENKITGGDERLKKSDGATVRGDRAAEDNSRTQADGTVMTMEERKRLLRSEFDQEVLPTPPKTPGWHYCWLSTTSSADPIYKRMQKGYEPVRVTDLPGFSSMIVSSGEFEGCISCNEMILFKLPEELYQDMMQFFHYEKPMEEEEFLRANAQGQGQDSNGRDLGEVEGFDSLARRVKTPTFN